MDSKQQQLPIIPDRRLLAHRIHQVRVRCFGEQGVSHLTDLLGIPPQTWLNYEGGVSIPGEILLGFLLATNAELPWLVSAEGPMIREPVRIPCG